MTSLPGVRTQPVPEWQKERLARWLREWETGKILAESDVGDYADDTAGKDSALSPNSDSAPEAGRIVLPTSAEPPAQAGQIRLLSPGIAPVGTRLVYLAILEESKPGVFLCAPFGRFSEPAFPGELFTGREAPHLRILCVWNARDMDEKTSRESWLVDVLSDEETRLASAVLRYVRRGDPLPAGIEAQSPPPVIHPADSRRVYREEESDLMNELLSARTVIDHEEQAMPPPLEYRRETGMLMAAETRAPYGTVQRFHIGPYRLLLRISVRQGGKKCIITVENPDGTPARRLDGGFAKAGDRRSLPIWKGQTIVEQELIDSAFILFDPDGTPLMLLPEDA